MIIICEKCQTRFRLADDRIPPGGAGVRCSRCQHRFHVKPRPPRESPHAIAARALENTPELREDEERGGGEEDPNLDNPTFLFDAPPEDADLTPELGSAGEGWEPETSPQSPDLQESAAPGSEAPAAEPDGELGSDVAPPLGFEWASHDLGAPAEVVAEPPPLCDPGESPLAEADAEPIGLGGDEDFADTSLAEGGEDLEEAQAELIAPGAETDASDALSGIEAEPTAESTAEPTAEEDLIRWDDLDDRGEQGAAAERPAGWQPTVDKGQSAPSPRAQSAEAGDTGAGEPAGLLAAEESPTLERSVRPSRLAAVLVGLALTAAGVRGLYTFSIAPFSGPEQVRGAGWIASEIEAFRARDAEGRRLLVVRGRLAPLHADPPPRVRLALVDAGGHPVGTQRFARLEWLHGDDLSPAELSRRLAGGAAPRAAGREIRGFTLLVDEPPAEARRFRLELLPVPAARPPGPA